MMKTFRPAAYFLLTLLAGCNDEKAVDVVDATSKPQKTMATPVTVEVSQAPSSEILTAEHGEKIVDLIPEITPIIPEPLPVVPPIFIDGIVDPFVPFVHRTYPGTNIPLRGGGGKPDHCGNGIKQRGEECDDGNVISRDGCSSSCALELFGSAFDGPDGLSDLYFIEPSSGVARLIGPIGFERVSGMDFSADNVLYGVGERNDGSDTLVLITIDIATGVGTEVGPLGGGTLGGISDISFRNSDNVLFAYDANFANHRIFTINTATGAATFVGSTGLSNASGNGMSFDLDDVLFHSQLASDPLPDLNTINQTTGQATFVLLLQVPNEGDRFSSMDVQPATGVMYGILNTGFPAISTSLATINTNTGAVRILGKTTITMDGIAFSRMP